MRKTSCTIVAAAACVMAMAGASFGQSYYVGKQLNSYDGFTDFNSGDLANFGVVFPALVEEGDMRFAVKYNTGPFGFWGYNFCGGDGTSSCYLDGGSNDMMTVERLDGADFGTIEMQLGDGWCKANLYVWVQAYNDGNLVAEWDIDTTWGTYIGVTGGGFDELHLAGYFDAATRDAHNDMGYNAIGIDNVGFIGGVGGPNISVGGSCPGTATVQYSGFASNTQVGIVFASNTGSVVIPNGPCAGTQLGLGAQNLQLVNTFNSGSGSGQVQGQAGVSACGGFLQLVESGSCATSNVDQLP